MKNLVKSLNEELFEIKIAFYINRILNTDEYTDYTDEDIENLAKELVNRNQNLLEEFHPQNYEFEIFQDGYYAAQVNIFNKKEK